MNGKSGAILHGGLSVPQQSLRRKTVWTLQIFASVQLAEVFHQDTRGATSMPGVAVFLLA
jgi:hypothetical protein